MTPYYVKAKQKSNDTAKVNALNYLAKYHTNVDLDSGNFYVERAYSLAQYLQYRNGMAMANLTKGILQNNIGNYPEALTYLQKAEEESSAIKDYKILAGVKLNLGNFYILTNDFIAASREYREGMAIAESNNLYSTQASLYTSYARVLREEELVDSAMGYYFKVLEMEEKILHDSVVIAAIYNNMASVYFSNKDLISAEKYLLKSYEINKNMGNMRYQIMNLGNLGGLWGVPNGDYNKAMDYFNEAVALAQKTGAKDALESFYDGMARINYNYGKYKEGFDYLIKNIAYKDSVMNDAKQEQILALSQEFNTRKIQDSLRIGQQELKLSQSTAEAANLKASKITYQLLGALGLMLLILVILFFVYRNSKNQKKINSLLQEKNNEINLQKLTIEEKKNELTDSINYAKRIQTALLPSSGYLKEILGDHFLLFRPKDIVSGDFYWVKQQANQHLFAVADCTGHGVPGAMVSMLGYETIEKISQQNHNDAAKFMSAINDTLVNALSAKSTVQDGTAEQVKDGMDLSLCIVSDKNKLSFCGANNSCFILRSKKNNLPPDSKNISIQENENYFLIELKATKRPVGFHHSNNDFISIDMKTSTFREIILQNAHLSLAEQNKRLNLHLDNWQQNFDQLDDITVLGVRIE